MDFVEGSKRLGTVDTTNNKDVENLKETPLYRECTSQVVVFELGFFTLI
jgi:hypothetical protein